MKKFLLLFLMAGVVASAQKVKIKSGNFKALKDITEYNVVFDYDGLTVGKFKTEEAFLEDKMKKREEKGKDEDFRKNWFADRENRYEPKFLESFNKRFSGKVKADKNLSSAKYTLKVKTTWILPGYNVGVSRKDAEVSATLYVYETNNPSNVLIEVDYLKAHGEGAMGFDFNSGERIAEGYAKMAKEFAKDIK